MADEHGVATAVAQMPEPANQSEAATEGLAQEPVQAADVPEDVQPAETADSNDGAPAPRASSNNGSSNNGGGSRYNASQPELKDSLRSVGDDNAERKEVADGRAYEIIYIVRANDPEAADTTATALRTLIEGGEGAIDNTRVSETRRLAYPIAKEIEGAYVVLNARFTTALVPEIDRFFKLEESVLRHMIIKE